MGTRLGGTCYLPTLENEGTIDDGRSMRPYGELYRIEANPKVSKWMDDNDEGAPASPKFQPLTLIMIGSYDTGSKERHPCGNGHDITFFWMDMERQMYRDGPFKPYSQLGYEDNTCNRCYVSRATMRAFKWLNAEWLGTDARCTALNLRVSSSWVDAAIAKLACEATAHGWRTCR